MANEQPQKNEQYIVAGNVLPTQVECQTIDQLIEHFKGIVAEHGDMPVLISGQGGGHVRIAQAGAAEFIDSASVEYDSQKDRHVHKADAKTYLALFIE